MTNEPKPVYMTPRCEHHPATAGIWTEEDPGACDLCGAKAIKYVPANQLFDAEFERDGARAEARSWEEACKRARETRDAMVREWTTLRSALFNLIMFARSQGDFKNGVTDNTGMIDEGEVKAAQFFEEAEKAMTSPYNTRNIHIILDYRHANPSPTFVEIEDDQGRSIAPEVERRSRADGIIEIVIPTGVYEEAEVKKLQTIVSGLTEHNGIFRDKLAAIHNDYRHVLAHEIEAAVDKFMMATSISPAVLRDPVRFKDGTPKRAR